MPAHPEARARTAPAPSPRVLVRGAGPVGMAAALSLGRLGLPVSLLAPAQPAGAADDIRAYALNAASVRLLDALRVWPAIPADARTAVHDMHVEGDAPGAAIDFSAWTQGVAELAWIVDAAELERALAAAVDFAPHVERVAGDQQVPPGVALTVLAEGRDSATRAALGVRSQRQAYGHRAVAARLVAARDHGGCARQWFRSPDVLALLPLDRPERGRGYGLVWSLPDDRAEALLALDDAAFEAALAEATGGAAGPLALAGPRLAWPLTLARAERVHGPGWVLVGDAAHRVHPLAGQGLNLGLGDVASLAAVLAAREPWRSPGDERLLARHARERRFAVDAMAGLTDGLLHLFAHPHPLVRSLRNRGLAAVDRLGPLKRLLAAQALGR